MATEKQMEQLAQKWAEAICKYMAKHPMPIKDIPKIRKPPTRRKFLMDG